MKYKKILVPLDGSEPSSRALETAVEFAKDSPDTEICALRIVPAEDMSLWTSDSASGIGSITYAHMIDPAEYRAIIEKSMARAAEDLRGQIAPIISPVADRVRSDAISSGSTAAGIVDYALPISAV